MKCLSKKVSFDEYMLKSSTQEERQNDNKTLITESTSTTSVSSSQSSSVAKFLHESSRQRHSNDSSSSSSSSVSANLIKMSELQRSNRTLQHDNLTMKRQLEEMEAKLKAMEQFMQQKEDNQELTKGLEVLGEYTVKQEKKLLAYKRAKKKCHSEIILRDRIIHDLTQERDALRSANLDTETQLSSLQQELQRAENHAEECKIHLRHQKKINRDLTVRLVQVETHVQTLDLDTDTPTKKIQQILLGHGNSIHIKRDNNNSSSPVLQNNNTTMGRNYEHETVNDDQDDDDDDEKKQEVMENHMANLEAKIRLTRRSSLRSLDC